MQDFGLSFEMCVHGSLGKERCHRRWGRARCQTPTSETGWGL